MKETFLADYLGASDSIPGWFFPDAAMLFTAYSQVLAAESVAGDVLEIGVYHGKSSICLAALRGPGCRFYASDLFLDVQSHKTGASGVGMEAGFTHNMRRFHDDLSFMTIFKGPSSELKVEELGNNFSFCHVDGGHSFQDAYHDIKLCSQILRPGGLLAIDDYYNEMFPGIAEAAIMFSAGNPRTFLPVAIGYNKALFQRTPAAFDINARFAKMFPYIPKSQVRLWDQPAYLFNLGVERFVDIARSTPQALQPRSELKLSASLQPLVASLSARPNEVVNLDVRVKNESSISFQWDVALSYHVWSDSGLFKWDNHRASFVPPLSVGEERVMHMGVAAPEEPGRYDIELDVVWEGISWFRDRGGQTPRVPLDVGNV